MKSRGASHGDDGDQKALLESGSYHHHQSRYNSNHQNGLPISADIIIRKTVLYLIALALAWFLFYNSSNHIEYYSPMLYHPLSVLSQNTTTQSNQSSLPVQGKFSSPIDNFLNGNLSLVFNNSSTTPAQESLPSNTPPPTNGPKNLPASPVS